MPLILLRQMLLELTRRGQEPLSALLEFGVTFLEDHAAEYIIQQGGWVCAFKFFLFFLIFLKEKKKLSPSWLFSKA